MAFLTKVRHFQESNRIYIFTCVVYIKMQGQRKLLTSESSLVLMQLWKMQLLTCPCDQIFGIPLFYIFVKSMTFLKFQVLTSMESYLFRRFLYKIIRPPLIKHVPEVTPKTRSPSQGYLSENPCHCRKICVLEKLLIETCFKLEVITVYFAMKKYQS